MIKNSWPGAYYGFPKRYPPPYRSSQHAIIIYNLACFAGFLNGSTAETGMGVKVDGFQTVAQEGDIPDGQGRAFVVGDHIVAVFHVDGQYHAINDLCPHQGASLADGHVEQHMVSCPWHGWRFRVTDGSWCDNPRIKTDSYPVRVLDGQIQVAIEKPD